MKPVTIDRGEFYDKILGCLLGKKAGLSIAGGADPDADNPIIMGCYHGLDLQIVYLKMLEDRGVNTKFADLLEVWQKSLTALNHNEYSRAFRNFSRGLTPCLSGGFENEYADFTGGQARSEIWAAIAPGNPQLASEMAWKDSSIDHAGSEGVYAAMMLAALESAAFVERNPDNLVDIGLQMIPITSVVYKSALLACAYAKDQKTEREFLERLSSAFGRPGKYYAPINLAIILYGLLWPGDSVERLERVVRCGFSLAGNLSTLSAIFGILSGASGLSGNIADLTDDMLRLNTLIKCQDTPATVYEMTEKIIRVAEDVSQSRSHTVDFGERTSVRGNRLGGLRANERARRMLDRDPESSTAPASRDMEITLFYYGEPVIRPKLPKLVGVSVEKSEHPISAKLELVVPQGWKVSLEGSRGLLALFTITADEVTDHNQVRVRFQAEGQGGQADFIFLSQNQTGFPK